MAYKAPLKDFSFLINDVLPMSSLSETEKYQESTVDLFEAVLEEAAKYSEQVLEPINRSGDEQGCRIKDGVVTTPDGFKEAYKQFQAGGWAGLNLDEAYGGQGLANTLHAMVNEVISTANPGFAMYRGLIEGAYNTIMKFGTDELKKEFLPGIASGEMLPTMNLTEPHAGSDLGLLRTKAVAEDDGSYTITGNKIFITGGEQDLTHNIPHLVLARLPDAPAGSRGISLFLTPKYYNDGNGTEVRNSVSCSSIEHKMGLKSSATCVMNFDGAKSWIIGEPHAGLKAMFTLMNAARLIVAAQGVCAAEGSLQIAERYAAERVQGKAPGSTSEGPDRIDRHPDVQRMLRTQKAYAQGGRALILRATLAHDLSFAGADEQARDVNEDMVQLLTPVCKAFLTDAANEATSLGVQVLGGHGFIREWGVEQWMRDVRIAAIYEGTNGIQAMDLVGRKLKLKQGALPAAFFKEAVAEFTAAKAIFPLAAKGAEAMDVLADLTVQVQNATPLQKAEVACDYLAIFGWVALAREWAVMARMALEKRDQDPEFYDDKIATAKFYMTRMLPRYLGHAEMVRAGLILGEDVAA
jgi:alkylation response protein AidB-like acyl-CoA dehydrogenase